VLRTCAASCTTWAMACRTGLSRPWCREWQTHTEAGEERGSTTGMTPAVQGPGGEGAACVVLWGVLLVLAHVQASRVGTFSAFMFLKGSTRWPFF
jgi:hypothetical protein